MDHSLFSFVLQPSARLGLLATAVTVAASFVSLSIFRHAGQDRPGRRKIWLVLAGVSSAFGVWAAHLVVTLAHGPNAAVEINSLVMVAAFPITAAIMSGGFAVASWGGRWQPAVGGAVNGSSIGLMHYVATYALVVPGMLAWNMPLVAASIGLGAGLGSAALTANQKLKEKAAIGCGVALLTLAFFSVHFMGDTAVAIGRGISHIDEARAAHNLTLATVVAGMSLIILVLGLSSTLIDRQTMHDNMQLLQQVVDAAIEGIAVVSAGRIVSANRRMAEMCGIAKEMLRGKPVAALFDRKIEEGPDIEAFLRCASGRSMPVEVVHRKLSFGNEIYAVHDLSERRAAEAQLQHQNALLQQREEDLHARNLLLDTALEHMSQGVCMYDENQRIVVCNERYARLYGLTIDDVKPGTRRSEVAERRVAAGVWSGSSPAEYVSLRAGAVSKADYFIEKLSDGRSIAVSHVPMPGGGWVCTHEDITEQRQAQAKIEHLARHDALTDLPNRRMLREVMQQALARVRPGEGFAVHCLDLDRFKEVNDALGHAVGDELMQAVARRLHGIVAAKGTLARIGGDEFVIVQNPARSPSEVTDLAAEIIAGMSEPFTLGDRLQVVLGATAGIAMAPADGTDANQLLKDADLALHRAKQEARGRYCFFEKDMDARMRARHELERNLRSALANGEFDLDFQPLLNLKRNEIACFEALLRWRTPEGTIPPSEFVPVAEETGLIVPIGEWALRQALAEAAKWPRHIRIAVNLSPVQFNTCNLAQLVMSALAASGVEANRLELEITESLLLQNSEATLATLHQLRGLGVRIALDDFGTGFSSLSYLRSFPFDKIKIDRCFIAGLADGNEESLAIVHAVARLGASLGIATTAEGVETQAQAQIARKEGFTEIQGYWLGMPHAASAIPEVFDLQRNPRKRRRAVEPPDKKPNAGEGPPEVKAAPRRSRKTKTARSA